MKIADIFTELTAANTQGEAPASSIIVQGIFQQIGKRLFEDTVKSGIPDSAAEVKNCQSA